MANIIKTVSGKLRKQGDLIFGNTSTLSFIATASAAKFPNFSNNAGYFYLDFDSPQIIRINFSDGNIKVYNTFLSSSGYHRFRFDKFTNLLETGSLGAYTFQNSNVRRNVFITFDKERLVGISMYAISGFANQTLIFPFSEYLNLKTFDFQLVESFTALDFRNIENSQIEDIGLRRVFVGNTEFVSKIDSRIFQLPLKKLKIGGNFLNYTTSNAELIGTELSDTLEILLFSTKLNNGTLPTSFSNLINLKYFGIGTTSGGTRYSFRFPTVVNNWTKLTDFLFLNNTTMALTGFDNNFTNQPDLIKIDLSGNITNITDFSFISQLQSKIKTLTLLGLSDNSRMTELIDAIYTMTTTKASITGNNTLPYRGIRLSLENYGDWTAAVVPTGVFQAPSGYVQGVSNGTPISDREKLYVLQNQYEYTITYRAS